MALGLLWGYFGVGLGSVWVPVGDLGSLDVYFAIIVESLWVYEGPFSKKGRIVDQFGSLSGHFWRMTMTLEAFWGHFGVTSGM